MKQVELYNKGDWRLYYFKYALPPYADIGETKCIRLYYKGIAITAARPCPPIPEEVLDIYDFWLFMIQ
jgi:hypothetical protein